jgi:acyltransferase
VPATAAARVAPVGRASLGVYAIHVPIVYGWSTYAGLTARVGPHLGVGRALLVACAVLAASFALHLAFQQARRSAAVGARWAWERLGALRGAGRAEMEGE